MGKKKNSTDEFMREELQHFVNTLGLDKFKDNQGDTSSEDEAVELEKPKRKKLKISCDKAVPNKNQVNEKRNVKPKKSSNRREPTPAERKALNQDASSTNGGPLAKPGNKHIVFDDDGSSKTKTPGEANVESKLGTPMLVKPGRKWFENEILEESATDSVQSCNIQFYESKARSLLAEDVAIYQRCQESKKRKSNSNWLKVVSSSGTASDKMAAFTVTVQESPTHNLRALDMLICMIDVKAKQECLMAVDTLKELFLMNLLPEGRKLRSFESHDFNVLKANTQAKVKHDRTLLLWFVESELKKRYLNFITAINKIGYDGLEAMKNKCVATLYSLLLDHSEQEQVLLTNLVNKLGDPVRKVASKTAMRIQMLLENHPAMKLIVAKEIEKLLFRPNLPAKASYYSICCLSQMVLKRGEKELAAKLINIYLSYFKALIKRTEVDTKTMSVILTGVNRAFPYSEMQGQQTVEQLDNIYKLVHTTKFNISVQALQLIYQLLDAGENISDRYYTALYRKLQSTNLINASKPAIILNLIFKSMKKDYAEKRVRAFVKRLLQICHEIPPAMACSILFVISEVYKEKDWSLELDSLTSCFAERDTELDEEHYSDAEMDGDSNLPRFKPANAGSWIHRVNLKQDGGHSEVEAKPKNSGMYDPNSRNPLYANSEHSNIWELIKISRLYHPSAALFAENILNEKPIMYNGDPLQDFTLIRFLDRFVYRNAKTGTEEPEEKKAVQATRMKFGKREMYEPTGVKKFSVNSSDFVNRMESSVPVDERFFFRYFKEKAKITKRAKLKLRETEKLENHDGSDASDDEFDEYLKTVGLDREGDDSDLEDDDLDFAKDITSGKQKPGEKKKKSSKDDASDDDDDDEGGSEGGFDDDEDAEFGADDFKDLDGLDESGSDDDCLEGMSDEDLEEFGDDEPVPKPTKNIKAFGAKPSKKRTSRSANTATTTADEISAIMDENTTSKMFNIGTEALSNKDKSSAKQIQWEMKRDQWMNKGKFGNVIGPREGRKELQNQRFGGKKFAKNKPDFKKSSGRRATGKFKQFNNKGNKRR